MFGNPHCVILENPRENGYSMLSQDDFRRIMLCLLSVHLVFIGNVSAGKVHSDHMFHTRLAFPERKKNESTFGFQ